MERKLARTLDHYLTTDPYEFGPADIGTDRPAIDQEAQDAAARNARATELSARRSRMVRHIHDSSRKELQALAIALNNILWMRESGNTGNESTWTVDAARRIIDLID
jgi:hypothetical protein